MIEKVNLISPYFYISFYVISLNVFHITFKRTTVTTFLPCIPEADSAEILKHALKVEYEKYNQII